MKYFLCTVMAIAIAWLSFISAVRADSPASIEIVSVKLVDKNQFIVEFEVKNTSDRNISVDSKEHANIWVRTADLNGKYYWDDPEDFSMIGDHAYKPVITLYHAVSGTHGNYLNWDGSITSPSVLKPGEQKDISITIDFNWLLQSDYVHEHLATTFSKDIWMRVGLLQSGGQPTDDEDQDLMKQSKLLPREEYEKAKEKLLNKYAPIEVTHGKLYKMELPKDGGSVLALTPIKAPF